ncbi:MAG: D-alanyl-D-alanine carboxypeptidase [Oscillospiraceae bacterium]|nr:D-alanyl-D-alanine carboxypeptidase [Oscillospiraceae bacterium]
MKDFIPSRLRRFAAGVLAAAMALTAALPVQAANPTYQLNAPVALLMEVDSRQILYQKNMDQTMYPASITKIMTALLACENAKMDETITMSYEATHSIDYGSSHIALDTDEQISVENALYALMLPSANDAANGLAEHVGGSMAEFAEMMNARAAELGCTNTHFANAHGLHDADHYTTAHDIALIAAEAVKHQDFCRIWGTVQHDVPPTNKNVLRNLWTQVRMLNKDGRYYYEACTGGKLGWTPQAKNTCVLVAKQNGMKLMCVLMGVTTAGDMFNDAKYLFDYGFEHLKPYQLQNREGETRGAIGYNSSGQAIGKMQLGYNITCLMDADAQPENITVEWTVPEEPILGSASGVYVTLTMEDSAQSGQHQLLGTYPAMVVSQQLYEEETPAPAAPVKKDPQRPGFTGVLITVSKALLIIAGVLVGGFVLLYLVVRIRYEYRKYKRAKKRREMAARGIYPKKRTTVGTAPTRNGVKK